MQNDNGNDDSSRDEPSTGGQFNAWMLSFFKTDDKITDLVMKEPFGSDEVEGKDSSSDEENNNKTPIQSDLDVNPDPCTINRKGHKSIVVTTDSLPSKAPTAKEEVELLAKELNEMSIQEREQMYEEIHGVDEEFPETPESVAKSLAELDIELNQIKKKPAYDLALHLAEDYVTSRKFRLMFLRADRFQTKNAARRIISYFEYKLDLFGSDKLVRPITLDDLSADDLASLRSGAMQILRYRDKSGRAVVFECPKYWHFQEPENQVK